MLSTQTRQRQKGIRQYVPFSVTEEKARVDIARALTMGRGETVLRENVRRGNVRCSETVVRLCRNNPQVARSVARMLDGYFGVEVSTLKDRVSLCIAETEAECRENALEAKYLAGLCDSSEKAHFVDAITDHIEILKALRDCANADTYGRIPSASL
jgi:predicted RNase H-like HicB family nuclease